MKAFIAAERDLGRPVTCVQVTKHLISLRMLCVARGLDEKREFTRLRKLVYRFLKRRNLMPGQETANDDVMDLTADSDSSSAVSPSADTSTDTH